jgi:hypothetical protein
MKTIKKSNFQTGLISPRLGRIKTLAAAAICALSVWSLHATQPVVAIHDSELTRALEFMPAADGTPTGSGTTSNQWWPTQWHYFVMPDSVKETLRSDGTAFNVVGDADINAGALLDTNGRPAYPIVISLASEAASDGEIVQLTNYVAAGGYLLVGSSAFTRHPDGTTRGDFALANEMGVHMVHTNLQNWTDNSTFSKTVDHRLVSHIPGGVLTWQMPAAADEVSWPYYGTASPQRIWAVQSGDAVVIAQGDAYPYLLVKPYGKGCFIYVAAMQPLIGHGGHATGMYAYGIFRNAIEWAFRSAKLPVAKLSPWPYPYDAAFMVRHDLENFQDEIANVAASAQFENANGAKGDYYFCTGTLREEMSNSPAVIAGLRLAVSNYNATIGPHNGGLPNPQNGSLTVSNYDYWHWGPDVAFDVAATNLPLPGFPDGQTYAFTSLSNSFADVEGWLSGLTNGVRVWAAPNFDATREASYQIENQLGVKISGDDKLSPFPSWTLSTETPDKRYGLLQLPVSDWYIGFQVAQSMDSGHTGGTIHDLVDYYYGLGALINLYSHDLSSGLGVVPDYITYTLNTNLHPRVWSANARGIYSWWLQRSNAQITATFATNGSQSITTLSISGASDPQTAVEIRVPGSSISGLQVLTNGIEASGDGYRTNGSVIKLCVGTAVTNAQVSYILNPAAANDVCAVGAGQILTVAAPGVLNNDVTGAGANLTAELVSGPANGTLTLNADGSFSYTPTNSFSGQDSFTYLANDGVTRSLPATVTIEVTPSGNLFFDDLARSTNADPLAPWVVELGRWTITNGALQGTASGTDDYSWIYAGTNWGDYSVQAEIQLPAGVQAWAGGLSGRVNPLTGENYTANVYPEGSAEGSSVLRLIKFHGWRSWNYTPMALVSLPGVGTNWHALKLTFRGNQISVAYDGIQVVSVTDNNFDAVPAYLTGGIAAHMFMDTPFTAAFKQVTVSPLPLTPAAANDSYSLVENRTLAVAAPGILTNATAGLGTNLTAVLASSPANGSLTLNTNGSFTYTPNADFTGTDSFTYEANDGVTNSDPATVTLTVTTNYPPVANNDSYRMVRNRTLTVAVPGILGNDTDANGDRLTAELLAGPANGALTLTTNGGFNYTPDPDFVGTDTFTYAAFDGATNSVPATVTLTVTTNHPPAANDDRFGVPQNSTLAVAAPGVLGNDTNVDGGGLTAVLVSGTAHGTLNLGTNGGFVYAPATNFIGTDSFTYEANDGVADSSPATVTITVLTNQLPGSWFYDDFTRPTNAVSLAPWVVAMGRWDITNGIMNGTASNWEEYAEAYVDTNWGDYSVQEQIQFPTILAWGAGLSGRLNPATGARYVALVCPEQSPEAAGGVPVAQLLKYSGWTTWTRMAQVNLPAVGTDWHTLKLAFCGAQIALYFDGNQVTNLTDNGLFDGQPAYLGGGISTHMFMDNPFVASYDNVMVWPLAADDNYGVGENTPLSVSAPGVLANDTAVYGTNLNAVLLNASEHGTLNLGTDGGFIYTPASNYVGTDSFTYQTYNGQTNLGTATVTIAVVPYIPTLTVNVDSMSRAYGQTNSSLTGMLAGVQNGDGITASYTTSANVNSPTGTYAIVPLFNDPGNRLENYVVITNGGTLSVTQATLAVNADNLGRAYGATNPVLTASYSGFLNGDMAGVLSGSPALGTLADTHSPVGTYAITIGPGTLSATNYAFSLTNGILTISPLALTVSADRQSRAYGAGNLPLTASFSGFVNGETLATSGITGSPELDTAANAASPAGDYPISVTNGTLNASNYNLNFVNGTLTVMVVKPTILSLTGAGKTNVVITWSAVSNVTYRARYQSDLAGTNWQDLPPDVTATNTTASVMDHPADANPRFYRVQIVP